MRTLVLTVSYDGAGFSGFARQIDRNGKEQLATIQGEIEHALALVYRREVSTVCAGRTDAGVHALGQQVSFDIDDEELEQHAPDRLRRSLNGILPEQIVVTDVREKRSGFSARFDATEREYRYLIYEGPTPPVFLRHWSWWVKESLDRQAMAQAAECLIGEHDFKSFCVAASAKDATTMRRVDLIEFVEEEHLGEDCLCLRVVGNAFLHSMIRTIVGTLVEVGVGRRDVDWVAEVLASCDRTMAGPTAPASGLVLWKVDYGGAETTVPGADDDPR